MANPEHIEKLREGVTAWNAWRIEHRNFRAELSGANLRGSNLIGTDLNEANLRGANLSRANLSEANLGGAYLRGADLSGANLSRSDLRGAYLIDTNLHGADLRQADLRRANLTEANLTEANVKSTFNNKGNANFTNLSETINLHQDQIETMRGDQFTKIPYHLAMPQHWLTEPVEGMADGPPPSDPEEDPARTDESARGPIYRKFRETTSPVSLTWNAEGTLHAKWIRVSDPKPAQVLPQPAENIQREQLMGLAALAKQASGSITKITGGNIDNIIGDFAGQFDAIYDEIHKEDGPPLIVAIKAHVSVLRRLKDHKEALSIVDQEIYDAFMAEANTLLNLFPILKEIEDPHQEELVPEEIVDDANDIIDNVLTQLQTPEIKDSVGPALPGVSRDMAMYPWETPRKRAAVLTAFAVRVHETLSNPPAWVTGGAQWAGILSLIVALIALF